MAELQTNPESSNTLGDSGEGKDASREVLQSNQGEVFLQPLNEAQVQRTTRGGMVCGKFGLLLWKNYVLQKRHMCHLLFEIFIIPILFIILIHTLLVLIAGRGGGLPVPLFLILSFIYPVANICKSIVHEKERRLKESMKMMGLSEWLHWSAWLAKSLLFLGISATMITIAYKWERQVGFEKGRLYDDKGNYVNEPDEPIFVAVFKLTDGSLLFLFLMSYVFSSITFAFLVSSFCSKATSSLTACSVLFFLPYIPSLFLPTDLSKFTKLGCSLVHNMAMGYGVGIMAGFEEAKEGVQWSTIGTGPLVETDDGDFGNGYQPTFRRDDFSMLHVIGMLILDGFLYLFVAIYLETVFPGEVGVPLPFYFPLMPSYWCGSRRSGGKVHPEGIAHDDTGFFEKEPENLDAGIQIKGLRKLFGAKVAVDGLTLNFYESQVTALLGHNGAGKTTTMSMLTGLYPPSSGTALVNGFDIRKDMKSVQRSLGLCPQHDVLFDEMTVEEHLKFFCLLKGYALPVQPEINRMLVALNLENKRKAQSRTLSGGMKRKLSVGIALVGGSKVVLLDEPTAGMDPGARRSTWDLISGEKHGRTILLSTHFMDEADLLGDRIAILAHGRAVCCGSSLFLKQKYGGGYHLIMVKEPNCKVNVITELLQKYIPDVVVDQNIGTELSYSLPDKKVSIFPQMFEELEKRKAELGVASYGCSITQMEEVFMRVGQQVEAESQPKEAGHTLTENSQSKAPSSKELSVLKSQSSTPSHEVVIGGPSQPKVPSKQEVTLDMNTESEVKMEDSPPIGNTRNMGPQLQTQQLWAMLLKKWIYTKRNKFTYITLAAVPVVLFTLVLFLTKIVQIIRGDDTNQDPYIIPGMPYAIMMTFTMSFFAGGFILFPIKEREVNSKHLQFVSGVPFLTFWMAHFLFDMGYYLIICILLTIVPIAIPWNVVGDWDSILAFFILIILYGWAVIPMTYLFSFLYTVPSTGYTRTAFLYFIGGLIFSFLAKAHGSLWSVLKLPCRFIPNYNLDYGIQKIGDKNYAEHGSRGDYGDDQYSSQKDNLFAWGKIYPPTTSSYDRPDYGIGQHLFYLFISGLVYLGLLFMIEFKALSSSRRSQMTNKIGDPTTLEDSDVMAENERIRSGDLAELCMSETMVLKDLTKYYGGFLAVDNVCLGVQHGECFGLLGVNGAGKTTTFKMLTGEIRMSSGDAYITGKSIKSNIKEVQRVIGYCPQFDALIPELTGRETISFYAKLRGIPEWEINGLVDRLAADLLLSEHVEKPCGTYSGGNKRKLSTAISLIGNPSMIFLDEPTAGMDPVARRYLWNTIIKVREAGSSVVLTSHSMEECEALCTRLAIMVNGKFRCLGSSQHLKNKFGNGYTLIAQLQASKEEQPEQNNNQKRTSLETGRRRQSLNTPPEPWEEYLQPLRNFIEKNFADCQLKDCHPCYVHYHIPISSSSWAQMFKQMEEAKALFLLEGYSIGQTSLEQVFLGFAKGQYNADT